jgi:hypothetical protein
VAASLLVFVLGNGLVAVGAAATTLMLRPGSTLDAALTFCVVALAEVALAVLVAGALLERLDRPTVLLLLALYAAGATALALRRSRRLGNTVLLGGGLPRLGQAVRSHPWESLLVALAGAALAWRLLAALVLPPYAYDALTYHLTIVATWLREENVDPTPLSLCCAHYPANAELTFAWPVLLLGHDALVDTVQLGFAALGALALAGLARTAGLGTAAAAAAAALFAVTPIVLAQASTNYADVAVAASALAALHFALRFAATGEVRTLVPAGLATGFVLGVKGTGVVWAAALVVLVAALLLRARGRIGRRAALAGGAAFLAGTLALGSFWYVRNWVEEGNPLHPFQVEAAGITVFDGPIRLDDVLTRPEAIEGDPWPMAVLRSWAADVDFWNQGPYDYQERLGGLGPLWPWLGLPLLVPLAIWLGRRRAVAGLFVVATAAVFLLQPYRWWSRFTIPLAAAGALAVVAAAGWLPRGWGRALRAGAVLLAAAGVLLASYEIDPAGRGRVLPARDVLGLVGDPASARTVGRLFHDEYAFLDDVPEEAAVDVDLPAPAVRFVYPLFGGELGRDVRPVDGSPRDDAWVVTGAGRPLDRALADDPRFILAFERRGLHAWRPAG